MSKHPAKFQLRRPHTSTQALGIPVLVDSPVGENIQDHVMVPITIKSKLLAPSVGRYHTGRRLPHRYEEVGCAASAAALSPRFYQYDNNGRLLL